MKRLLVISTLLTLVGGCSEITQPADQNLSQASDMLHATVSSKNQIAASGALPLRMSNSNFRLLWAVERDPEVLCGGSHIAGGAIGGTANFPYLGKATLDLSAAWDIGNLIANPQFQATSPNAGGPVAPVLSGGAYPYAFHFNPFTQQCGGAVTATGQLVLTAANGDQVFGVVTGGETHRLDFMNPGDGIENFTIIDVIGGTGRFAGATGSFTTHIIARFDYSTLRFVMDLAELLPGGTLAF